MRCRFANAVVVALFVIAPSLGASACLEAAALTCGGANCAAKMACPFYNPASLCGENASGDVVLMLDPLSTVDGKAPPAVRNAVRVEREAMMFGTSTTVRTFTVARLDDGRIRLPCTLGRDPAVEPLAWPGAKHTDPIEWDPPSPKEPGVTSCRRNAHPWDWIVIRHEQDDDVRYFTETSLDY